MKNKNTKTVNLKPIWLYIDFKNNVPYKQFYFIYQLESSSRGAARPRGRGGVAARRGGELRLMSLDGSGAVLNTSTNTDASTD